MANGFILLASLRPRSCPRPPPLACIASRRVVPRRDATIIWNVIARLVCATGSTGLITPLWKLETSCKN